MRWAVLLALTIVIAGAFSTLRLAGALLIGPMAAAIMLALLDAGVNVPRVAFLAAQALVGCMIAGVMHVALLREMTRQWPLFLFAVTSVIVAAIFIGWLLTRWRALPGTSGLWGAFPGAATAMVIMAEAYGADIRLVAFMQYLRVVMVAIVATSVAHVLVDGGAGAVVAASSVDWTAVAVTLLVALVGGMAGWALRLPAGPLIGPMLIGAALQNLGWSQIALPPPLLAAAYAVIGWSIGLRFDRAILRYVAAALPKIVGAIAGLIAVCGLFAAALVHWGGVDPLTAYLAMSPGGADSIAIIAASARTVDMPFVMALQMTRFLVILLVGPSLARFLVRNIAPRHSGAAKPNPEPVSFKGHQ